MYRAAQPPISLLLMKNNRPRKIKSSFASSIVIGGAIFVSVVTIFFIVYPPEAKSNTVKLDNEFSGEVGLLPVPVRAIARGEKLANVEFIRVKWPIQQVADRYIKAIDGYKNHIAQVSIPAYLPVPLSAITDRETEVNVVVERIPEGMRAITVKVDLEAAVEGWARSGNYVDVIVVRKASTVDDGMEAQVIAENVKILSAGKSVESNSLNPPTPATITLLVNQQDALRIKAASSLGKLVFSLRGVGDQAPTVSRVLNQKQLLGGEYRIPKVQKYKGFARGPDGKTYRLISENEWVSALDAK
jgi:Flp pilus assembly protein CpaB